MNTPTPHIEAKDNSLLAPIVLMPGDPLRAKLIAENFLENAVMFNQVRNIFGYTGYFNNQRISVMASGMGIASMGIYSYELFAFYGVEKIIRIGTCGAYIPELKISDIVLATDAYSESTYALVQSENTKNVLEASYTLNKKIIASANKNKFPIHEARIHSSDVFYSHNKKGFQKIKEDHQCVAVEMEAFALFANAQLLNKQAATLLTVSDQLVTHEKMNALERQTSLTKMIKIALGSIE